MDYNLHSNLKAFDKFDKSSGICSDVYIYEYSTECSTPGKSLLVYKMLFVNKEHFINNK